MFYDKFDALCTKRGVSNSFAAEQAGFSRSLVSKWKNNDVAVPSPDILVKIAKYFNVPVSDLVDDEENKKDPANIGGEVLSVKQIEMIEKIKAMSKEELDKKWAALSAIFDI